MDSFNNLIVVTLALGGVATGNGFNVLHHLAGNSPWFSGPEVTGISSEVPAECTVDMAAFISRHGSRYADNGAYREWANLSSRIHAANFTVQDRALDFLPSWKPVMEYPEQQIAQLSTTGYKELYDMGATYRLQYPDLYAYNTNFTLWSNYYYPSSRVRDSARLFARGYLGPNATELGSIFALNASNPRSFMNSLGSSDLCPAYDDDEGGHHHETWKHIFLPPIQARLNKLIHGDFQFTGDEVYIIPYLCGFETQIMGSSSPWCSIFTEEEILQYEYAQDLRYWYGNGLGTQIEKYMMLPVLDGLVQRFVDGPEATYTTSDTSTFVPPKLIAAFTNDGQISQLAAAIGVFDEETPLPATEISKNRLFKASNFVTMRGTIGFERLHCASEKAGNGTYLRIRLNDVVYPVAKCQSGPGKSCPLAEYQGLVKSKLNSAGNFSQICNVKDPAIPAGQNSATFFTDIALPFQTLVKP
ncbi:acid phosphatase PHO12 precursor [Zopfia rhizophila CBS 207.26]|uniref:Acid phosphatase PHO12 n=1 Tax=Zopfia rhizophila CBS 207.26 TaxID=1314779 RepID=A0A6A6E892_9PEZI|nr:acid phosphatase PHO12 precursor [Zopfia rhizophila CBS 207.26]